jgi:diaminopimelate epimerase
MRFVKLEGCGNDYVFVDAGLLPGCEAPPGNPAALAVRVSERRYGIGSDGLILLDAGARGPVRMRMWNADGTEGLLCLNGLRGAAKYAADRLPDLGDAFDVETASGVRPVRVLRDEEGRVYEVEVRVGPPDFRREALPAAGDRDELWDEAVTVEGVSFAAYGVSVGNPHLVLMVGSAQEVEDAPLEAVGRSFEDPARFPGGINVHVAAVAGEELTLRHWERGSGATLACGSGAAAAFAVARRLGAIPAEAAVRIPGGVLLLHEAPDGVLVLRGPVREVFTGDWPE